METETTRKEDPLRRGTPPPKVSGLSDLIPSSSPAFVTQEIPVRARAPETRVAATVLPVLLPPSSLRPLAFRTITKKHNLTLASSALQVLAAFIGKHCGAGWREEGLAEQVLEEVAKSWKKNGGGVIVDGDGERLHEILKTIAGCMAGGKVIQGRTLSRQSSFAARREEGQDVPLPDPGGRPRPVGRDDSQTSLGLSNLALNGDVDGGDDDEEHSMDPRSWLKVIGAFEQPKIMYNAQKNQFEKDDSRPSIFPAASQRTHLFHYRYHMVLQRIMRNEAYQKPSLAKAHVPSLARSDSSMMTFQNIYKITPIVNMLGRSGSQFLLFGLLNIAPTGDLALSDLTGSIRLDLGRAKAVADEGTWFTPGMFVLVEGVYEDEYNTAGGVLGNSGGVGGTIGGKFIRFHVRSPPCERRPSADGGSVSASGGQLSGGGGLGWVDLLGVGSERAVGPRMRRVEKRVFQHAKAHAQQDRGRGRIAFLGEVNLESPTTLRALKYVLQEYESQLPDYPPLAIVIMGHFVDGPAMAGTLSGDIVEYKECFNSLASVLSEVPKLLQSTTFVFVPSDHDPWPSAASAGASTVLPRRPVPDMFTTRVKRAFAEANAELETETGPRFGGKAVWTTNPSRLSIFGPSQEIVLFRDDMLDRLRRNAVHLSSRAGHDARERANGNASSQAGPGPETFSSQTLARADETQESMDVDGPAADVTDSQCPTAPNAPTSESRPTPNSNTTYSLAKTILDQGYLSPFPLSVRPVLWDYVSSLNLHPPPTALVLLDPEAPPATLTYQGCVFMNPGPLLDPAEEYLARWCEYDAETRLARLPELEFEMRPE